MSLIDASNSVVDILTCEESVLVPAVQTLTLNPGDPTTRLPTEVLLDIFFYFDYLEARRYFEHVDICRLTWICSRWRTIITSETRFWTVFRLTWRDRIIDLYLDRSNGSALGVHYDDHLHKDCIRRGIQDPSCDDAQIIERFQNNIRSTFREEVLRRTAGIVIRTCYPETFFMLFEQYLSSYPAPRIETFLFVLNVYDDHINNRPPAFARIFGGQVPPLLRNVLLGNLSLHKDTVLLKNMSAYLHFEAVKVHGAELSDGSRPFEDFLRSQQALERMWVVTSMPTVVSSTVEMEPIQLSNIRHVHLEDSESAVLYFLRRFRTPNASAVHLIAGAFNHITDFSSFISSFSQLLKAGFSERSTPVPFHAGYSQIMITHASIFTSVVELSFRYKFSRAGLPTDLQLGFFGASDTIESPEVLREALLRLPYTERTAHLHFRQLLSPRRSCTFDERSWSAAFRDTPIALSVRCISVSGTTGKGLAEFLAKGDPRSLFPNLETVFFAKSFDLHSSGFVLRDLPIVEDSENVSELSEAGWYNPTPSELERIRTALGDRIRVEVVDTIRNPE